ncbi:MAG: hypothetical protein M0R17_12010 [Candidatus Omnitrophica bacterium]|jgi:hypothetical protein|nr:hypothetical protein [Candidatus Omnitrophota bacterium]
MKKYKLIKEYPGSPSIPYIVKKETEVAKYYVPDNYPDEIDSFETDEIENWPKNWEEIIEYPMINVFEDIGHLIYTKNKNDGKYRRSDGLLCEFSQKYIDGLLDNNSIKIIELETKHKILFVGANLDSLGKITSITKEDGKFYIKFELAKCI